ncbi:MAG: Gfo/Idh/MocA family oxidoreductase [Pseudomonadota bacterium]
MTRVRVGLLGAAKIAPPAVIKPAAQRSDCEVVAVASRDRARGEAFAAEHGIAAIETDYEALVRRDDIDLVYNGLPPSRHKDLSIAALEAGKPVLCEKPFAMNAAEARAMVEAAGRADRPLIEAFHYRFHPVFQRVMEILSVGALGEVSAISATFTVAIPYRKGELRHTAALGGGALMDLGCYPLHWVRTVAGCEPDVISAVAHEKRPGVDVAMEADLAFPSGVSAKVSCSMARGAPFAALLKVTGAEASLTVVNPIAPHFGHEIRLTRDGETQSETVDGMTTYDHQLAHVIDVLGGRAAPITGGADAVANMAAVDAMYRAAGMKPRGEA